jgi:hypothetical protein
MRMAVVGHKRGHPQVFVHRVGVQMKAPDDFCLGFRLSRQAHGPGLCIAVCQARRGLGGGSFRRGGFRRRSSGGADAGGVKDVFRMFSVICSPAWRITSIGTASVF